MRAPSPSRIATQEARVAKAQKRLQAERDALTKLLQLKSEALVAQRTKANEKAILKMKRQLFVKFVGRDISRQEFTDELTRLNVGELTRGRLLNSADKLRKLGARTHG